VVPQQLSRIQVEDELTKPQAHIPLPFTLHKLSGFHSLQRILPEEILTAP
jgi:hypothetical protein